LFAVSSTGNRWTRNPKTRNIRRLIDDLRNHVGIGGNEAADQAAKDPLNDNQEPYPPQDLIKWMKGFQKGFHEQTKTLGKR
jgi:hypothetical protein